MDGGAQWLFHFADPMNFDYDITKVDGVIDFAATQMKLDIRKKLGAVAATKTEAEATPSLAPKEPAPDVKPVELPAPELPKDDPKAPAPSLE